MVLVLEEQNADFDLGTKSEGITERIIHWKFNGLNINYKNILFVKNFHWNCIIKCYKQRFIIKPLRNGFKTHDFIFLKPLMIAAQGVDCDVMIAALLNAGADPKIVDYNVR